jgi:hypothetical protein
MTPPKALAFVIAPVLCVTTIAIFIWRPRPRPQLSRESFEKVHKGMTRAEVYAFVGPPTGRYTDPDISCFNYDDISGHPQFPDWWMCEEGALSVLFENCAMVPLTYKPETSQDRALSVRIDEVEVKNSNFLRRLGRWLGH